MFPKPRLVLLESHKKPEAWLDRAPLRDTLKDIAYKEVSFKKREKPVQMRRKSTTYWPKSQSNLDSSEH
jgi:hypothetical protein